jgi:hypothetical protein
VRDTIEDRRDTHKWALDRLLPDPDSPAYALHELGMTIVVVGEALLWAMLKQNAPDPTREDCTCHSTDGCRRHGTWRSS